LDVCRQLKSDPETSSLPVLQTSATFVRSQDKVFGLESGADGYLIVPVEPEELLATVKALLRMRRAESEAKALAASYRVTLASIGDAVIATDTAGRVTFLNPVAEALTGWSLDDARGRALDDVFHILDEDTREPHENPVKSVLAAGSATDLGARIILVARSGVERLVADSAAPIRD